MSEPSDITSVSDLDSLFSESPDTKDETKTAHVGKVIVIEDVAFVTYVAFIPFDACTKNCAFQIPGFASVSVHQRD